MLTCCPVVVCPPFAWQRGSLPSLLSFALQLALEIQVPVGSLLPYGSQPSRWGHPCGVEAGEVLNRNKGLVCFSFHFGWILRDVVTLWVETVFDLILNRTGEFLNFSLGCSGPSRWLLPFEGRVCDVGFRTRLQRRPLF